MASSKDMIKYLGGLLLVLLVIYSFRVYRHIDGFQDSKACPSLSPAAADASVAADKAKAADIAKIASKAVSEKLAPAILAEKGVNITCPSGDPIITVNGRNTKFSNTESSDTDSSCNTKGQAKNNYMFDPTVDN